MMNTPIRSQNHFKMIKLFTNSLMIICIVLIAGCDSSQPVSDGPASTGTSQTEKSFSSISDYNDKVNGENFKTGVLNITKKDKYIYLSMKFSLSADLKEMMMNTQRSFYFNFADVEGQDNLTKVMDGTSPLVEGDLDVLKDSNTYLISQQIKIKEDISSSETKEILSPENYELQVLNENKQLVAVVIGLEISMINQTN